MKLFVDLLGIGFEIYLALLFYGIFYQAKKIRKLFFALGFCGVAGLDLVVVGLFQNQVFLPLIFVVLTFMLGLYFQASISSRILLAFIFSAVMFAAETMVGVVQTRFSGLDIASVQNDFMPYMIGVLGSKLLTLILIYMVRVFVTPKGEQISSRWFNLSMLLLPFQSLLLCFVVQSITAKIHDPAITGLSELALFASFILIAVTTFIMSNQFKALRYKQDYETAQYRLQAQIAHYSELSAAEQELKAMRHDLKNELLALAGLLAANRTQEAAAYLVRTEARILATEDVVNTGYPAIDAIVNSKIKKARESNIAIYYKMLVETRLLIDPFDLAIILGNALDNAVEAVLKSTGVSTDIHAAVMGKSDYLSVLIENQTSEPVDEELRTSKKDPANHGFGIRQMKIIAAKYDGDLTADFDEANHKFSLRILLRNQAAPEK